MKAKSESVSCYRVVATIAGVAIALLSGCGGGSGDPTAASSPPPPSSGSTNLGGNGGYWEGTVSAPGSAYDNYRIIGLYAKSGEARFWIYKRTHGGSGILITPVASTVVSNDEFSGSYNGAGNGVQLRNGTSQEQGDFDVVVDTRNGSISGSFISNDSGAAQDNTRFDSLTYDRRTYNYGSSQQDLLKNGGAYSFQFNLPGTGVVHGSLQLGASSSDSKTDTVTGQDTMGCSYTGSVVSISSKYNAYDVTLARSCAGGATLTLSGLGVFYPAGTVTVGDSFGMLLSDGGAVGVEILAQ